MKRWTLEEISQITGGRLLSGDPHQSVTHAVSDSRQATAGAIFVPLPGERVDGHDFLADAAQRGAVAAFVRCDFPQSRIPAGLAAVAVPDPAVALQTWARHHLRTLDAKVVGVTGSVGKTTTKEMIAAVLAERFSVLKNEGNLNTEIGLPLTVLQARPEHQVLVLEMAMRGPGEILQLTEIAAPDVAVITNVRESHIELLGSIENIAAAKGEILQGMAAGGTAVLNAADPLVVEQAQRAPGRVLWYGREVGGESVSATDIANLGDGLRFTVCYGGQQETVNVPWPGLHNVSNALAAVATGIALGMSLPQAVSGLKCYQAAANRLNIRAAATGFTVIDDTYNASPDSMRAALQVLLDYPGAGRRIAVLGDMLELGERAVSAHREVGQAVAQAGVDRLLVRGELAQGIAQGAAAAGMDSRRISSTASNAEAARQLRDYLQAGDLVLIKGSRGMQMEQIVYDLLGEARG
jgi:UDP-N-acetylmuramoyl-tripeptide--D-alanyl-D-alanine ligase